jgi:hypothetical protein
MLNGRPGTGIPTLYWKGATNEERERSHRAFVDKYKNILTGQPFTLPQEMYVVARAHFKPYDAGRGGLPIIASGFLDGSMRSDDPNRRVHIAGSYTAAVANRMPDAIKCELSACEAMLSIVPDYDKIKMERAVAQAYPVFLLVKVRVTDLQATGGAVNLAPGYHNGGQAQSAAVIVGDIGIYADEALTRSVASFQ